MVDFYTKAILTIIAASLTTLLLQYSIRLAAAISENCGG